MADSSSLKPASAVPALLPQGEQVGKPALPLGRAFTLIGSRNRAHLHLLSSTVSRNHACIVADEGGIYVRDLASRAGITVNGRRVKEADLHDGDLVQVGSFKFRFKDPAGEVHLSAASEPAPAMLEIDGATLTSLDGRTILIGRRPTCDIPLEAASVSNTHAIVFALNGQRYIRDLGSRTGTLVNGKAIHQEVLEFGDQIRIGDTDFRYVSAEAPQDNLADTAALGITVPEVEESEEQEHEEPIGLQFPDDQLPEPVEAAPEPVEAAEEQEAAPQAEAEPTEHEAPPTETDRIPVSFAEEPEAELEAEPPAPPADDALPVAVDTAEPDDDLGLDFLPDEAEHPVAAEVPSAPEVVRAPEPVEELPPIEPEPVAPEPEPQAEALSLSEPEPISGAAPEPEPVAQSLPQDVTAESENAIVEPAPVAAEPEPIPEVAPEPEPVAQSQPQDVAAESEGAVIEPAPEPVAAEAEPEPIAIESEPEPEVEVVSEPAVEPSAIESIPVEPELPAVAEGIEFEWDEPSVPAESAGTESAVDWAFEEPAPAQAESETEAPSVPVPDELVMTSEPVEEMVIAPLAVEQPEPVEHYEPAPAIPLRVEDVDLSVVKFEAEPTPPEAEAEVVEAAPEAPAEAVPLLDLVQDIPVVTEPSAAPELAEAGVVGGPEIPTTGKGKKPRAGRKKSPSPSRRSSKKKAAEPAADEIAAEPIVPPADVEAAAPQAGPEIPLETSDVVDFSAPPAEPVGSGVAADVVEVVETTEPTPESALDLESALESIEPPAAALGEPAEMVTSDAALTDSAFGRVVQDLTGSQLGALVEEEPSQPPSHEDSAELPPVIPEPVEPAPIEVEAAEPEADLTEIDLSGELSEPEPSSDVTGQDDLHTLTGEFPLEEPAETDSTMPPPLDFDLMAGEPADAMLELETTAETPAEFLMPIEEESLELPFPLDESAEEASEPDGPQATVADEPIVSEASPPATPEAPAQPEAAKAGAPVDPFYGMGRDLGSFIGGMPLALASGAAAPQPSVAQPAAGAKPGSPGEPLAFVEEPAPIPGFPANELADDELLELFDETAEKLDALPDELHAIGDVSGALAEPHPAVPQTPPKPPRPSIPGPPPRARPQPAPGRLRSLTASGADVKTDEAFSRTAGAPSFAGGLPSTPGRGTGAFDGLAAPAVRQTDVFSQTAFPPMDEALFGPPIPAEIPPTIRRPPAATPTEQAKAESEHSPQRRREAIPPNRQARHGQAGQPAALPTPPSPPVAARRPWWRNIRVLLPLLIIVTLLAVAAILLFFRQHGVVQGTLHTQGLDKLSVFARREQMKNLRDSLLKPDVQRVALGNLHDSNVPPGFVADPASFDTLSREENFRFDEPHGTLVLTRPATDGTADQARMKAVLAALYAENAPLKDRAATVQQQLDAAQAKLRDLEQQHATAEAAVAKLSDQMKAAADDKALAGGAQEILFDPKTAADLLEQKDAQLRQAMEQANAAVQKRHEELARAEAAAAQSDPNADPQVRQIRLKLVDLNIRLDAARLASSGHADEAAHAFDDTLRRIAEQLARIPATKDPKIAAYLSQARQAVEQVRQSATRQKQDAGAIAQLRRQLADRHAAHLRQVWAGDGQLNQMLEDRDAQAHRYGTATDSGYADEAAKIRGVLDGLDQKIDARRKALGIDDQYTDDLQLTLQRTIARMEKDQEADEQRVVDGLALLSLAPGRNVPAEERKLLADLGLQITAAKVARQQDAVATALSAGAASTEAQRLEKEIVDQQAQLDARQPHQDPGPALVAAQRALDAARKDAGDAATAYTVNRNLLTAARELKDAEGRSAELAEMLRTTGEDVEQLKAQADVMPVVLPPDESSVSVVYGQDMRLNYLLAALVAIVAVFAVPVWLAVRESDPEAPFATMLVEELDVPGHEVDDYPLLLDDDEDAAVA